MLRNKSITVLKQGKGKDFVVIDRKKYTEKCINLLHTDSFIRLDHDQTKTTEVKFKDPYVKSRTT